MDGAPAYCQILFSTALAELTAQPFPLQWQWMQPIMILLEYQARRGPTDKMLNAAAMDPAGEAVQSLIISNRHGPLEGRHYIG